MYLVLHGVSGPGLKSAHSRNIDAVNTYSGEQRAESREQGAEGAGSREQVAGGSTLQCMCGGRAAGEARSMERYRFKHRGAVITLHVCAHPVNGLV